MFVASADCDQSTRCNEGGAPKSARLGTLAPARAAGELMHLDVSTAVHDKGDRAAGGSMANKECHCV